MKNELEELKFLLSEIKEQLTLNDPSKYLDQEREEAFYLAIKNNQLDSINFLINNGLDLDHASLAEGDTPLNLAYIYKNYEVFDLLLSKGANIDSYSLGDYTILHFAAMNGDIDFINKCLSYGANIDLIGSPDESTALYMAVKHNKTESVKLLLEAGASVNKPNRHGNMPLHMAAWNGNLSIIKILLENGAYINARTKEGYSALFFSACNQHKDVIDFLLDRGARPIDGDPRFMTKEIVKKLKDREKSVLD